MIKYPRAGIAVQHSKRRYKANPRPPCRTMLLLRSEHQAQVAMVSSCARSDVKRALRLAYRRFKFVLTAALVLGLWPKAKRNDGVPTDGSASTCCNQWVDHASCRSMDNFSIITNVPTALDVIIDLHPFHVSSLRFLLKASY